MLDHNRQKRGSGELVDLPVQRERVTREFTAANGARPIVSSTMETAVIFVIGQVRRDDRQCTILLPEELRA